MSFSTLTMRLIRYAVLDEPTQMGFLKTLVEIRNLPTVEVSRP